jgi:cobalt-zinc-cadmium efflux system membrane fusion protein
VEEGEAFTPRVVKLGKKDREHVEIISGLAVGDSYAAHNTFCLKAEHEKEEAEHSH